MIIDFSPLELKYRYKIMSRSIIPRPIAWIVTEGKTLNIAPFSYFMALSSNPPTLIVSIGHKKDGTQKDTLKNILQTKKCTICSVTPDQITQMHASSESLPEEVSEAEAFGIATKRIVEDFPPIITDSPSAFFCELNQVVDLSGSKTIPLIVEIKKYYIADNYFDPNYNFELDLVARVGREYRLCNKKIEP
ncbi:flavin reductase family protein [Nitratiruptor tergarcus]|uniref:NADH-FMN oxidoreductase RutF, flavin reductase (DIM6/NTAB) family n=1 Tax=Nitratiruptor tergarcus DSM 16512 TaxID=1069081 RepID=A0A1W1WQH6_9BACT|nr:flavin reductase family protein [Nitratiruptor tergarcus]SMC08558.1 NADH-FMN oxidoreductase RutF, flavin reductase (DIM6/NTAB) family [Nitratiruptor tergarcus DSM 16512]